MKRDAIGAGALLRSVKEGLSEDGEDEKYIRKEKEEKIELEGEDEGGEGEGVCIDSRGMLRKEGEEWELKLDT